MSSPWLYIRHILFYDDLAVVVETRITNVSTVTQQVYGRLRDEIISGVLRPGTRLVRRTLSKRLGVSPMPVTEALLRLEVDGLVENLPLRGARVRPLTLEELYNDQILREAIECQAARLCAENASKAELSKLMSKARLLDRMLPKAKMREHVRYNNDDDRQALNYFLEQGSMPDDDDTPSEQDA